MCFTEQFQENDSYKPLRNGIAVPFVNREIDAVFTEREGKFSS